MTPITLRKERRDKFLKLILESILYEAANRNMSDEFGTHILDEYCGELADKLADASASRTESTDFDLDLSSPEWAILAGQAVSPEALLKQNAVAELENVLDKQLTRLGLTFFEFPEDDKARFRKFIKDEQSKGRELSVFVDWWLSDDFRREKMWKLDPIRQQWLKAFSGQLSSERPEYKKYVEPETQYVPNPNKK